MVSLALWIASLLFLIWVGANFIDLMRHVRAFRRAVFWTVGITGSTFALFCVWVFTIAH